MTNRPIETYLKYYRSWKKNTMKDNSSLDDSFYQNLNEYKKIIDISTLNSENETQYYGSAASGDHLNHLSNQKGKYYSRKKNSTEEWNKNISRTINRINQIINKEDSIDKNPLKRQIEDNSYDYKDPLLDNKDLLPNHSIEINTTENKRESRKSKNEKSYNEVSPKRKNKKSKESKRKGKKNKEYKKKDEAETKSPNYRRYSTEGKKHKKDKKNQNNMNDYTNEIKYDADVSLNSESGINKVTQKNIGELEKEKNEVRFIIMIIY